jgi:uncharacterized protein (DUF1697 family)
MKHVAFFRNLNLGRPKAPTRDQFEAAFLQAGAVAASSFLTNGTIVFEAGGQVESRKVLAQACGLMQQSCGLVEPGFVRTLAHLRKLVQSDPFASLEASDADVLCISFLHAKARVAADMLPMTSPRGDVRIFAATPCEAFAVARPVGSSIGSPNALLEKRLEWPATTRNWNTVLRLLDKHA